MRSVLSLLNLLSSLIFAVPATADPPATHLADTYEVRLAPSGPDLSVRLPAVARSIPLAPVEMPSLPGFDHLQGRLDLGPERAGDGRLFAVARKKPGRPYALLFIDRDLDGVLADEEKISTRPERSGGKLRSQFETSVRVRHGEGGDAVWEDYPIRLRIQVDDHGRTPELRLAGPRGARSARLDLNGFVYDVVVADTDHDGIFGGGDGWTLHPALATAGSTSWRRLDDFVWARGVAWKLELDGTRGVQGRLVRHDPGIAPSEDAARRDPRRADRLAPRAAQPVVFATEIEAAVADAEARGLPFFLAFGADWCLPCRQMEDLVYTAEEVAAAARDVVCIRIDGDVHGGLKRRYHVTAYPTGILLAPGGAEIARFQGYRGVEQMTAFFRRAHP